jgi:hypothetical protein
VNEFVNECRREWKRLGVRRSTADEMATELGTDLEEGTPEEVLGADATDPRSFARAWAAERGVVRGHRRARLPAALAVAALIAAIAGAVLTIEDARSEPRAVPFPRVEIGPHSVVTAAAPPPVAAQVMTLIARLSYDNAVLPKDRVRLVEIDNDSNTLGIVLLIVGLAVLAAATLVWSGRVALGR